MPSHTTLSTTALFSLVLLVLPLAQGANFRWLDSSPARHFSDRDWQLLGDTVDLALNTGRDGQRFEWSNPDTGSSGTLEPAPATGRYAGGGCRRLKMENHAGNESSRSSHTFCRQEDGSWKIAR